MLRDLFEQIINGEYEGSVVRLKREFTLRSSELIENFNKKYANTVLVKEKAEDKSGDCGCEKKEECDCEDCQSEMEESIQTVQKELDYFMAINEIDMPEFSNEVFIEGKLKDGLYKGIRSGYSVKIENQEFKSKSGVRGMNIPCMVSVKEGKGEFLFNKINEGYNQKDYRYYVVSNGKIITGWEYKEDAQDDIANQPEKISKGAKVYTKLTLVAKDLDPANDKNWYSMDESKLTTLEKMKKLSQQEGK